MHLQVNSLSPAGVVAIIIDGSVLFDLLPINTVEGLAECLALLHEQQGSSLLRADIRLVSGQASATRTV
jgi:hypothetical protein